MDLPTAKIIGVFNGHIWKETRNEQNTNVFQGHILIQQ